MALEKKQPDIWFTGSFSNTKSIIESKLEGGIAYPLILATSVENNTPNQWDLLFSEPVSFTGFEGFDLKINQASETLVSITGSGTSQVKITATNNVVLNDVLSISYLQSTGNVVSVSSGNPLLDLFDAPVNNNVHGGISPEAQAVINRMTNLTQTEQDAIIAFVDAEVLATNWAKYDEFFSFGLSGANALVGWIAKTATAVDAPVLDVEGVHLNGTSQYIDSNFIPSVDGSLQDDSIGEAYIVEADQTNASRVMGVFDGSSRFNFYYQGTWQARVNTSSSAGNIISGAPVNNELISMSRLSGVDTRLYRQGVQSGSSITTPSVPVPTQEIYIGARNASSVASSFYAGVIATTLFGKAIGFDQAAHNTNLLQYLTDLGTFD